MQRTGYGLTLWASAEWRADAVAWMDERLAAAGIERTGAVTQPHLRPWGTVLTAPTTDRPVWLKAPGPETAFEVELYQLFLDVVPDRVLVPLGADPGRGMLLLPDGGTVLGDRLGEDGLDLVDAMVEIMPRYAELQRELAPHTDRLLSFGIADMRAAAMPDRFDEALAHVGEYVEGHGEPGDRDTLDRATARRETFTGWCERLAAAPVPPSLDHNDLHPWNVFVAGGPGDLRVRFYDWGDAVVAHPFASMLVGLGSLRARLDVPVDDPAILRVRDAYLEAFGDLAPHAELVETLELACWVAKIARALTWQRALRAQSIEEAGEFARAPLACVASLNTESYLHLGA